MPFMSFIIFSYFIKSTIMSIHPHRNPSLEILFKIPLSVVYLICLAVAIKKYHGESSVQYAATSQIVSCLQGVLESIM